VPSYSQQVLVALVDDRHHAIACDFAFSRRFRLRRRVAAAFYALAGAVEACAAVLDENAGTVRA
jgi:hypothetical protein